ncbi:MAG: serine/threonine-protein kinase [Thermoanaerobaculales bacterium]|jgi:hypothetical protein|nr:serine/threonine-protein kinase [Thermoanaerobaculales bacterium]
MNHWRPDPKTAAVDAEAAHGAATAAIKLPDRWRLLELLGTGGQAAVWLAEDRTLGQRVALKVLPADADERTRARWLEEVRQGRQLSHRRLIRIFDVVEAGDRPVAVMEYVPGGTLADRVVGAGAQPVEDVVRWAGEVLEVLAYLHDNRVVHRDVKPSNLLVMDDGSVKLSDLGLVRSLDRSSDLTATMEGVGTPRFMAPEQLRGEEPSAAVDLYSLGVTLYQLLTGRLPFDGDSAFQIADAHLHLRPEGVREHRPECPRWLARFVERLLEKDPEDRFPSAQTALAALDRQRVGFSRRALRWAAAAVVTAAVIGSGVMWLRSAFDEPLHRVEIDDGEVVARSESGSKLWSEVRPGWKPRAVVTADVVGDGEPEVVVGWRNLTPEERTGDSAFFEVYSPRGEVIRTMETAGWGISDFPEYDTIWHLNRLHVGNLTAEGSDVVWALTNPRWYPCLIGGTSFRRASTTPLFLFSNSGHVQNMSVVDVDGDGRDEVVAVLINNPLGFQRVLVTMGTRSRLTGEACGTMKSPDIRAFLQARLTTPTGCVSFTPLGSDVLVVEDPKVLDGGIELVLDGETRRFDGWGNPEGSPLFGNGPEAREAFWADVEATCARLRLARSLEPPFSMEEIRRRHPQVISEAPTEVAAYLVAARALASGGHRENAILVLRDGSQRHPGERDLQLRLGEQLLIAGRRAEGRDLVADSVNLASSGRNHTDQVTMMILDAALNGDVESRDETRRFIANLAASYGGEFWDYLDLVWFFFQGQWNDQRVLGVDTGSVHRWLRVLQEWAIFEAEGDVKRAIERAAELEQTDEIRELARVFEARVRAQAGDPASSYQRADTALRNLQAECRIEYPACAWVPLAEWVAGRALVEIEGRETEAEELLARAVEHAPGTVFASRVTP